VSAQSGAFAFPIFVEVRDRAVLVAGGGREAVAKAATLASLGACVTSWAPQSHATRRLDGIARIRRVSGPFRDELLDGALLAVVGTGDRALDHQIADIARGRGVLVNTVDDIPYCDWSAPAILRRGRLTVAVGTGGIAPALAARVRDQIENELLGPEFADLVEIFAEVRPTVTATGRTFADRRALWYDLVDGPALEHLRAGREAEARAAVARTIATWAAAAAEAQS
jgi:precorrin-2 dehydrogenase/sirohydrochlorin ferrochelatase